MRRFLLLTLVVFAAGAGCNSSSSGSSPATSTTATTEVAGTWAAMGTGSCTPGCAATMGSYQVTVAGGKMTGSGVCSSTTPMCKGASVTFSGTRQ